jgi:hypothetical protein
MSYCGLQEIAENIIEEAQKQRDTKRHSDDDRRKPRRFLSRRPVDVADLNPRFAEKSLYALHIRKL